MPFTGPGDPSEDTPALTTQALRLYVEKTAQEIRERNSWIRQPNNLISVVAIALSLTSIAYQAVKDHSDTTSQELASLTTIASDLTQIDAELLTSTAASEDQRRILNNRRVVLLAEADPLIQSLGDKAPIRQLAVLAPEYADTGDIATATKYLSLLTTPPATEYQQVDAWRSLGRLAARKRTRSVQEARTDFAKAAAIFPDPSDSSSINQELIVHDDWATFELKSQSYSAAFDQFQAARLLLNKLPCTPWRDEAEARIEPKGESTIALLRQSDPQQASTDEQTWTAFKTSDPCPDQAAAPTAPDVAPSDAPTTTVQTYPHKAQLRKSER